MNRTETLDAGRAVGVSAEAILRPAPTRVMGILNVTPDSFSDGGRWASFEAAVARGHELMAEGADLLDIGGESTRPGSLRVPPEEEQARVVPVVRELAAAGIPISVDTINASTARAVVEAGALIVNDVSGGLYDPQMTRVVAETGALYILQHWRGTPDTMNDFANYEDVVTEVHGEMLARLAEAEAAGLKRENIILDPGLGFAKDVAQNWTVLAHLEEYSAIGLPMLVGASRKRFLADIPRSAEPTARDHATAAITVLCAQKRMWAVRVHEVAASADAVRVVTAVEGARAAYEGVKGR